ncbi:unnamed protein product [Prorocentrum cordatum]|uniref:C2 domain-containing protein n=1 Tax=Prorocentrum cordatum TaxID=2364126 RepID=A0ABN9TPG8_9DINO|nr:unnamed protein product [Polarella glacialis]
MAAATGDMRAGDFAAATAAHPAASSTNLRVKVADAQGLRLMRGGEIRLVITLCARDDPEGDTFGAKVTPWLEVPGLAAPQWKARETSFSVAAERCFQAEFVDSAYVNIDLYQRGHTVPGGPQPSADAVAPGGAAGPAGSRSLNWSTLKPRGLALNSALQRASSLLNGPTPDRGEVVGSLRLPVGKQLACGAQRPVEWAELLDAHEQPGRGRAKGSLLLDVAVAKPAPPAAARASSPEEPSPAARAAGSESCGSCPSAPTPPRAAQRSLSPPCGSPEDTTDDSASESGPGADAGCASTSSMSAPSGALSLRPEATVQAEAPLAGPDLLSPRAIMELLRAETPGQRDGPSRWLPPVRAPTPSFDEDSAVNIFTINETGSSQASSSDRFKQFVKSWSPDVRPPRMEPMRQKLRSALDPGARRQHHEVKKWRVWYSEFCVLNEIEQRLDESARLLTQAAASMKRFGDKHAALLDPQQLSAFLRDAALYSRSEADVPGRLETLLGHLETVADDFRNISLQAPEVEDQTDLQRACEDLQVDIAVLLESALMTAQQALAEYKKMHCRLELLVTEYEPVIRLELAPSGPVFLPLVTDERHRAAVVPLPEQALQWALDFSQLAGSASRRLGSLARELGRRRPQLRGCASELRSLMLRLAAAGGDRLEG